MRIVKSIFELTFFFTHALVLVRFNSAASEAPCSKKCSVARFIAVRFATMLKKKNKLEEIT